MEARFQGFIDSLPAPLADAYASLSAHPWLQALVVAAVSYVLAQLADFILTRWIGRMAARTTSDLDDRLIKALHRPVIIAVFFFGLSIAARLVLKESPAAITVNILQTITIFVWVAFGIRATAILLELLSTNDRFQLVESRTVPLFENLARIVVVGVGIYMVLGIWQIDATAWLTSAGIAGLALGFAAKDTLANLFSGMFILADRPYEIGDFIVLDSGERGRVTNIGIRSSRLLTRDDIEITIPNAVIANAKIINETAGPHPKERVRIPVGVAYGSDVDQLCEVLEKIALAHEHVCADPEPRVRFRRFGESSLDFELLCWIDEPVLRGRMVHELNMEVYKALAREKIEIPFPQRDLHIKEMPAKP